MTEHRKFLPFALPDIGDAEINEVVDSLRSGWLTTGPKTRKFEADFAEYIGGAETMAVNSATAGLHLALEACGVERGDEVIVPTYTFTSTAEIVRYFGADPVFVDVDEETLNMRADIIEKAVTKRTKAVIPVHIAGLPCNMKEILSVVRRNGIKVVEDAAHAFPVEYEGKIVGSLDSDCTVFSFYATKTITTGEGGMVATKNPEIAKRIRVMRLHGIDRDAFDRYTSEKPSWYYEIIAPGYKYNMSDIMSSMGIHQLKRARAMKERRREIAMRYLEGLGGLPLRLPAHPDADHAWHLFIIRLDDAAKRDGFIRRMAEAGIGCGVHFMPLHAQPYYREKYDLCDEMFPVASDSARRAVSLPIYTKMTDGDVERVIAQVREILTS